LSIIGRALKYAHQGEVFVEGLVSDIKNKPENYAVFGVITAMAGAVVAKRFFSLGRLHRKADRMEISLGEIKAILKNNGSASSTTNESRKSSIKIIQ